MSVTQQKMNGKQRRLKASAKAWDEMIKKQDEGKTEETKRAEILQELHKYKVLFVKRDSNTFTMSSLKAILYRQKRRYPNGPTMSGRLIEY